MNPDTARQLFESGGILHVLDAPKEMEFGIDMYSWQIGPQFRGIKMIPPGIHFCYYSERDSQTKQLANRQGFFIEIHQPNEMLIVIQWSPSENLFQRQQLTPEEYEFRRNQRYELDRLLGQYPLDTFRQWLALSNHLRSDFLQKLLPPSGQVCSAEVFNPNEHHKQSADFSIPKNLTEAESRLPKMTPNPEYALRLTTIDYKQTSSSSGSNLTQSKLDRTDELEKIILERFDSNIYGLLGEFQLSFLLFFLGQTYEGFEQWKRLLHLFCSCEKAFCRWPMVYTELLQMIFFQLKYFGNDSSLTEHLFTDIDQQDNFIYKSLENLFANVIALTTNEQMEGNDWDKFLERCQKMKDFLKDTYQWTFDDEPDDEKPIIVELNS